MRHKDPATLAKQASSAAAASLAALNNHRRPAGCAENPPSDRPSAVVASENVPAAGGTVTVVAESAHITVTVASGAYPDGALLELSHPDISAVDGGVVGIGLQVLVDGRPVTGTVERALTIAIDDPAIRQGGTVEVWDGKGFAVLSEADVSTGRAVIILGAASDLVVVLDDHGDQRMEPAAPDRSYSLPRVSS